MKSLQNFYIVKNMNTYFLDDIHKLQKIIECPFTSQNSSINTDRVLLPDLKSIILNQSYLERVNQDAQPYDETYSKSVMTHSSSKHNIHEEQILRDDSISSDYVSNEF